MVEEQEEQKPKKNREEEEIREILGKIQSMEAGGQQDKQLLAELQKRGVQRTLLKDAWQQHLEDFPEHEHEQPFDRIAEEESLEERLREVKAKEQAASLYDVSSRMEQGERVATSEIYNVLEQTQLYLQKDPEMSPQQRDALQTIEQKTTGYINNSSFEEIKRMGKLKIGDSYLQDDERL